MKKLGVVITDGVGYRNFVMSDFLHEAASSFDAVTLYSGLPTTALEAHILPNVTVFELPVYKESIRTWIYRKLKEIAHLQQHKAKTYGINDNLKHSKSKRFTKRGILNNLIHFIAALWHSENAIRTYERWQFRSFKNHRVTKHYLKLLKEDKPDLLFFTHQRPPFLAPMLSMAKTAKIPTTSFIFSWDNLASKGRMLGEFDNYLVWSNLMKEELIQFYPKTNVKSIRIVGTPQFEPYVLDRYSVSRKELFEKFELDVNKKIICYSCADSSIGQNDETHIRALWSFIEQYDNLQLLIRTSPAEDGQRFKALKSDLPRLKWNIPKWSQTRTNHAESWSQRLPSEEDVLDLKAILSFSDVNVNMLSTMSLDFMLFDKPVINTVFGNESNGLYNDQRFLNYKHYKHVIDSKSVTIAKNESELHQQLEEALNQPDKRAQYRKDILQLEIGAPLKGTSKRLVKGLLD